MAGGDDDVAKRVPKQHKVGRRRSLLMRCCCCLMPSNASRFKRFDDEPSAEFRQRMERAQTALDLNNKRKSTIPNGASGDSVKPAPIATEPSSPMASSEPPTPTPALLGAVADAGQGDAALACKA